ncbi:MAG: TIGR03936 family radical SAM-associated protein [Chitinophagales bacterium]
MRVRVEYGKGPNLKFVSHLDMVRLWERLLRRSKLPVSLTEGFNPHYKLSLGTVLPVGVWGCREYLDFELNKECLADTIIMKLKNSVPPGITISSIQEINSKAQSLMAAINAACYRLSLTPGYDIDNIVGEILQADEINIKSRGDKIVNIRLGLQSLNILKDEGYTELEVYLAAGNDTAAVRLWDLIEALTIKGVSRENISDIWREGNYVKLDSIYLSPLEAV